jgi:hypothetical protein
LSDTPERRRRELEFCSTLGAALHAVKGYAAPETGRAYARARVLWERSSWVPRWSSFKFPMGSQSITWGAENSVSRSAWTKICCA